jgi:hypothetical protein
MGFAQHAVYAAKILRGEERHEESAGQPHT